ncbi:hypothetical protein TNCV_293551 [Trichonephila clavipes]|nr:hypothetical protein TNCV_293551 [Trichonephila clavipes]
MRKTTQLSRRKELNSAAGTKNSTQQEKAPQLDSTDAIQVIHFPETQSEYKVAGNKDIRDTGEGGEIPCYTTIEQYKPILARLVVGSVKDSFCGDFPSLDGCTCQLFPNQRKCGMVQDSPN